MLSNFETLSNSVHQSLDKFLLSGERMDHSLLLLPMSRDCNNFTRSSAFDRRDARKNSRRWARLFGREILSANGMKNCVSPRIVFISKIYTRWIKHYFALYLNFISFLPWIPLSYVLVYRMDEVYVLKWMASWTEVKIHKRVFKLAQ